MIEKLKSLGSDTLIYGIAKFASRFLTFLLVPIYTNYIPKGAVGEIYYLFAVIAFTNIIFGFGMEPAFLRFYTKDSITQSKKSFTHAFLTISIITVAITGIIFASAESFASYFPALEEPVYIIRLAAMVPLLDAFLIVPYAYMRMTRRSMRFAITQFTFVIIGVGLNLFFILVLGWGTEAVFWSNIIASFYAIVIVSDIIFKNIKFKIDKGLLKQMLRFGIPTIPASFAAVMLQLVDRPILKALTDPETVAVYSINYKLGIPMMLLVSMFDYAWRPFFLSHYEEPDAKRMFARVLTYFTMLSAGIFLLTGLFIEYAVRIPFIGGSLINPDYWDGMVIIPIILGGYFFHGWFTNFQAGFHITKKTEYLPIAIGAGALVNVAMNFLLIPIISYHGAAWATLGGYAVSAGILYAFTRKVYPTNYEWRRLVILIISTLAVYFAGQYLTRDMDILMGLIVRLITAVLFFGLLRVMGFFTPAELHGIKSLFRRK